MSPPSHLGFTTSCMSGQLSLHVHFGFMVDWTVIIWYVEAVLKDVHCFSDGLLFCQAFVSPFWLLCFILSYFTLLHMQSISSWSFSFETWMVKSVWKWRSQHEHRVRLPTCSRFGQVQIFGNVIIYCHSWFVEQLCHDISVKYIA